MTTAFKNRAQEIACKGKEDLMQGGTLPVATLFPTRLLRDKAFKAITTAQREGRYIGIQVHRCSDDFIVWRSETVGRGELAYCASHCRFGGVQVQ